MNDRDPLVIALDEILTAVLPRLMTKAEARALRDKIREDIADEPDDDLRNGIISETQRVLDNAFDFDSPDAGEIIGRDLKAAWTSPGGDGTATAAAGAPEEAGARAPAPRAGSDLDGLVIADAVNKLLAEGKAVAVIAANESGVAEIAVASATMPPRLRYRLSRMALDLMLLTQLPK